MADVIQETERKYTCSHCRKKGTGISRSHFNSAMGGHLHDSDALPEGWQKFGFIGGWDYLKSLGWSYICNECAQDPNAIKSVRRKGIFKSTVLVFFLALIIAFFVLCTLFCM